MGDQPPLVAGVDGWKRGWVAVLLGNGDPEVRSFPDFASLAVGLPGVSTIVVDIPIGLPEGPTRQADVAARGLLGARASSVFSAPPRVAIEQDTFAAALVATRRDLGVGISAQAYALREKILEVGAVAVSDGRVLEGHPEVSFWALADGRPMQYPKKSWNGQMERRHLLEQVGIALPDQLPGLVGRIPVDDVLDAAVMAWTAQQLAEGKGVPLPDPPERIGGRDVAIWHGGGVVNREERIAYARKLAGASAERLSAEREAEAAERARRLSSLPTEEAKRHVARISYDSSVGAMGPVKTPAEWAKAREAIRAAVIASARAGHTITYEAIELVAHEVTGLKLSYRMVGRMCMEINRGGDGCLLSSIIVRSDTGRPGQGFEPFAHEQGFLDPVGVQQQAVFRRFGSGDADSRPGG